ncbi:hypothetical protein BH23ACT2_BH23ACT2_20680 [soil metagenome]
MCRTAPTRPRGRVPGVARMAGTDPLQDGTTPPASSPDGWRRPSPTCLNGRRRDAACPGNGAPGQGALATETARGRRGSFPFARSARRRPCPFPDCTRLAAAGPNRRPTPFVGSATPWPPRHRPRNGGHRRIFAATDQRPSDVETRLRRYRHGPPRGHTSVRDRASHLGPAQRSALTVAPDVRTPLPPVRASGPGTERGNRGCQCRPITTEPAAPPGPRSHPGATYTLGRRSGPRPDLVTPWFHVEQAELAWTDCGRTLPGPALRSSDVPRQSHRATDPGRPMPGDPGRVALGSRLPSDAPPPWAAPS